MPVFIIKLRPLKRPHFHTDKAKWSERIKNADPQCCLDHTEEHIEEILRLEEQAEGETIHALVLFDPKANEKTGQEA